MYYWILNNTLRIREVLKRVLSFVFIVIIAFVFTAAVVYFVFDLVTDFLFGTRTGEESCTQLRVSEICRDIRESNIAVLDKIGVSVFGAIALWIWGFVSYLKGRNEHKTLTTHDDD